MAGLGGGRVVINEGLAKQCARADDARSGMAGAGRSGVELLAEGKEIVWVVCNAPPGSAQMPEAAKQGRAGPCRPEKAAGRPELRRLKRACQERRVQVFCVRHVHGPRPEIVAMSLELSADGVGKTAAVIAFGTVAAIRGGEGANVFAGADGDDVFSGPG